MAIAPYGSEFRVNTATAGDQDQGSVTALANGRFVVTWNDNASIKAQIFNANGSQSGGEITVAATAKEAPVVAGLTDGGFAIAWTNRAQGVFAGDGVGTGSSIWARAYNADGTVNGNVNSGNAFRVNDVNVDGDQFDPAIAALTGNRFVITWTSEHNDPNNPEIQGRVYGSSGAPSGSEFDIFNNSAVSVESAVAGLADGNYVVAWHYDSDIGAQILDGSSPIGTWFTVNTTTAGNQSAPAIAASEEQFEIVWTHPLSGAHQIRGRTFDQEGGAMSGDFQVPATSGSEQVEASITFGGGAWFTVWRDSRSFGGDSSGSHIEGAELTLINQGTTAADQRSPSIAALRDGRYIVVWTDPGVDPAQNDTSGSSVRARIFDARASGATLVGTSLGDDLIGTRFADILNGGPGDDQLDGSGGNDAVGGGDGLDTLHGGGDDDKLFGNAANDRLFGGDGKDALDGGTGADTMAGGAGDDAYTVDDSGDAVDEGSGSGVDTVLASISFDLGAPAAKGAIENLVLTGAAIGAGGNNQANSLTGNDAANRISGREGNDTLTGGGDADTFVFDTKPGKKTNVDHITDFTPGSDRIELSRDIFTKIKPGELSSKAFFAKKKATEGKNGKDLVIYDTKSGELFYDKDGKGGAKAKAFAVLDGAPALHADDFVIVG